MAGSRKSKVTQGSKEAPSKMKQARRPKNPSQNEDDGTQMEQQARKPGATSKRRRRNKPSEKTENETQTINANLRLFALETATKGPAAIAKEFADIKASTAGPPPNKTAFDANPDRNRYKDVFCVDESRVALTWPPGSTMNYIHANWVPIRGQKRFICTQGPTEKTIDDFWRLVWQEKCAGVVMLCGILECGKKKCEQYWPEKLGETITTASGISVRNIEVTTPEMVLTKLTLSVPGGQTLQCNHYLWKDWPDRGVPTNYMACFRLLLKLKELSPVVVHCSAGIGRTGTIVGLEMCQQTMNAGEKISMPDIVRELRRHRHGSVQTDLQYVYMHRVVVNLAENKKAVKAEEVEPFYNAYDAYIKTCGR